MITISVNRNDLRRVNNRIKKVGRLPKYALDASEKYLREARTSIAKQLMIEKAKNRSVAPRGEMKASILNATIKKTLKNVELRLPQKASQLDLGLPRKVNLQGNVRARKWVQKYYNRRALQRVRKGSLMSKPYGPKGGLTGYLQIVRHPFVAEGHRKVRHRLKTLIKQELKKRNIGG